MKKQQKLNSLGLGLADVYAKEQLAQTFIQI